MPPLGRLQKGNHCHAASSPCEYYCTIITITVSVGVYPVYSRSHEISLFCVCMPIVISIDATGALEGSHVVVGCMRLPPPHVADDGDGTESRRNARQNNIRYRSITCGACALSHFVRRSRRSLRLRDVVAAIASAFDYVHACARAHAFLLLFVPHRFFFISELL